MQETNDVMSDFKASKRGTLKLVQAMRLFTTFCQEAFKSYMNNHPNIQIDLTVDTAPHIIDKLRSRN